MTKTLKQNDDKEKTQKNVFSQIKKNTTRGRGLSNPTKIHLPKNNVNKEEGSEAVDVHVKRSVRIGTYITEEVGDMLDDIILRTKRQTRKKPKIAEVLELAITNLYKKTEQG